MIGGRFMLCKNCHTRVEADAVICPNCGANLVLDEAIESESFGSVGAITEYPTEKATVVKEDKPNVLVNILSLCCIPVLGIVLFFVWKDTQPNAAKSALIFSLINIGLGIILSIILFVLGVFAGIMDASMY